MDPTGEAFRQELGNRRDAVSSRWLGWARDRVIAEIPPSLGVHVLNQLGDLLADLAADPQACPAPRLKRVARELHLCGVALDRVDALWDALGRAMADALEGWDGDPTRDVRIELMVSRCRVHTSRHYFEAADARLHVAEDELRPVLASSQVAFLLVDNAGKVRVWNEGFRRLTGFSEEEVVGRLNVFDLIPRPADVDRILDTLATGGMVDGMETAFRRAGGGDVPVTLSVSMLTNRDGHPVGSVGVCFDATERVRLEEERRTRAEMLRQVVMRSPFPMGVVGSAGRLLVGNDAMASLFGCADAAALIREVDLLGDPRFDPVGLRAAVEEALAGQEAEVPPFQLSVPAAGETRQVHLAARLYPLATAGGQERGAVVALEDLTRQQFLQRQVLQSQKLSAVGQMLTGITHELNNKLCVILGYGEILQANAEDPHLSEQLGYVAQAANGARAIIESLSAFARPREPRREVVDLNRIARDTLTLVQVRAAGRPLKVTTRLDDGLPETRGDAEQLGQVLLNVCINAQQATEGRTDAEIVVTTRATAAGDLLVVVEDNGPGIPVELLDRVFDPFFTTKEVGKGTGLGLSVSYAIARAHGGDLTADNRRGGGARFTLRIPRRHPEDSVEIDATPSLGGGPRRGIHVLVVDDEEMMCRLLADYLATRGAATIDTALNGEEALQRLSQRGYDLVVCDIRMPKLDGPALYQWIARRRPDLARRVLFTTGDTTDPETIEFLVETGCPCLPKPFNLTHLDEAVDAVLAAGDAEGPGPGAGGDEDGTL